MGKRARKCFPKERRETPLQVMETRLEAGLEFGLPACPWDAPSTRLGVLMGTGGA